MVSARSEPDRQSRDTVGPQHICPTHIADWLTQAARAVLSARALDVCWEHPGRDRRASVTRCWITVSANTTRFPDSVGAGPLSSTPRRKDPTARRSRLFALGHNRGSYPLARQ